MKYYFEWDSNKARINESKHGLSFENAISVFNDPFALTIFDDEHGEGEERWITLGMNHRGIIIVVCHTFFYKSSDNVHIRIYSVRKATKREKTQYGAK